jgi:ABC-type multidrug transport system ATPase subunit
MSIVLRARTLWKSYAAGVIGCSARVWVLRGASLDLHEGECVAVLGARGAGTTTLLHCLAGLRRLDAGCVESETPTLLFDTHRVVPERASGRPLLLVDDGFDPRRRSGRPSIASGSAANALATIIATHELARVRDVADRVLLLHHGGLLPLDHPSRSRRVAERRPAGPCIE